MMVVIILAVLFAVMGIIFLFGKGSFLIAGYNTANKDEKSQYDEKKLNRCFCVFCFGISIVIGITGYVNTEYFAMNIGLPLILALVIFVMVASGTYCKK